MFANRIVALAIVLLAGCDGLSSDGRSANSGTARVRFEAERANEDAEAPEGVGAPMAWRRRDEASGPIALYGSDADDPAFAIRCDRARKMIALSRSGAGSDIVLQVGGRAARYEGRAITAGADRVETQLPMQDGFLDRLGARGSVFTVQTGDGAVEVHSGVAIRRVVESCRTPPPPPVEVTPPAIDETLPAPLPPPAVEVTK